MSLLQHASVDWKIVGWLALGSLPCAGATLWVLKHLMSIGKEITGTITFTLGVALLLTAVALLVRSVLIHRSAKLETADADDPGFSDEEEERSRFGKYLQIPATILVGAVLGILVTLSSVGAGALGTVALLFLFPNMRTVKIVGTDLAHAIPLTAVAGLGHLSLGNVDLVLLGSLLVGSLPGIWIGSHISALLPEKFLRPTLATILLIIGVKFVLQ